MTSPYEQIVGAHLEFIGVMISPEALERIEKLVEAVTQEPYRIPFELFTTAVCRGAESLGTACGQCEKCVYIKRNPPPHRPTAEYLAEELKDAIADLKSLLDGYKAMRRLLERVNHQYQNGELEPFSNTFLAQDIKQTLGGNDES